MLRTPGKKEPLITLKVGPQRQEVTFLVDTGAERSTVQSLPLGCKISEDKVNVIGAKGEPFRVPVIIRCGGGIKLQIRNRNAVVGTLSGI